MSNDKVSALVDADRSGRSSLRQAMRRLPPLGGPRAENLPVPARPGAPGKADCPKCGGLGWVRLEGLDVTDPRFGRALPCACWSEDALRTERGLLANLTAAQRRVTFDEVWNKPGRRACLEAARKLLADKRGWLTMHGGTGNGKSTIALALTNEALRQGFRAVHWSMPLLLDRLRRGFGDGSANAVIENAQQADLLVLEEFDQISGSDWAVDQLRVLMHLRYDRWPTTMTVWVTNADLGQMAQGEPVVMQMLSRMREFMLVKNDDADARPAIGRQRARPVERPAPDQPPAPLNFEEAA